MKTALPVNIHSWFNHFLLPMSSTVQRTTQSSCSACNIDSEEADVRTDGDKQPLMPGLTYSRGINSIPWNGTHEFQLVFPPTWTIAYFTSMASTLISCAIGFHPSQEICWLTVIPHYTFLNHFSLLGWEQDSWDIVGYWHIEAGITDWETHEEILKVCSSPRVL